MDNENISSTLPLPKEKMPECWNQEERMSSLFSPFRSRSANSQDWISKYKFWHNLIYEWLQHNMQCSFSILDINRAFKRKGCTPHCIVTVIEELLRNKEIIEEAEFNKEPCETWTAWSVDMLIKKPINWSFSKVKNYIVSQNINNTEVQYIHLQIVQELSDIILSIVEIKKDHVLFSIPEIIEHCQSKTKKQISEDTIRLVLHWLRRKKRVTFRKGSNPNNELLVKISTQLTSEITEVEEGMYKLIKQENELIKEIESMEKEKLNIIKETKSYLAKDLRQLAKTHLRRKIELEKTIEKRAQALANLRTLITSIEDAHSNSAILSAYKAGSNVLKKMGQNDLTEYDVKDVMDEIHEVLEENKETNMIFSETLNDADSDTEFEKELAELLNDDIADLPAIVPQTNSEVEKLEQRLNDLRVEDLVTSGKNVITLPPGITLPPVPTDKKKMLKEFGSVS